MFLFREIFYFKAISALFFQFCITCRQNALYLNDIFLWSFHVFMLHHVALLFLGTLLIFLVFYLERMKC